MNGITPFYDSVCCHTNIGAYHNGQQATVPPPRHREHDPMANRPTTSMSQQAKCSRCFCLQCLQNNKRQNIRIKNNVATTRDLVPIATLAHLCHCVSLTS